MSHARTIQIHEAGRFHSRQWKLVLVAFLAFGNLRSREAAAQASPSPTRTAQAYLNLIENFAGFAEQHWNEKAGSYDAAGSGVTWARGNGGMCLVAAVLLSEYPDRESFSPQKIDRKVLLDHVRRTLRTLCFTSNVCTDPRAVKPGTWGGPDPRAHQFLD